MGFGLSLLLHWPFDLLGCGLLPLWTSVWCCLVCLVSASVWLVPVCGLHTCFPWSVSTRFSLLSSTCSLVRLLAWVPATTATLISPLKSPAWPCLCLALLLWLVTLSSSSRLSALLGLLPLSLPLGLLRLSVLRLPNLLRFLLDLKPVTKSWPLSVLVLLICVDWVLSSQVLLCQVLPALTVLGLLAAGLGLLGTRGCTLPTGRLLWICALGSTLWLEPTLSWVQSSSGHQHPIGVPWGLLKVPTQSHRASQVRQRPRYTSLPLDLKRTTSTLSPEQGSNGARNSRARRGGFVEPLGDCCRGSGALRASMACSRRSRRFCRGSSFGGCKKARRNAAGAPTWPDSRSDPGVGQCWRRCRASGGFYKNHNTRGHFGRRSGVSNWHRCDRGFGRFGGGVGSKVASCRGSGGDSHPLRPGLTLHFSSSCSYPRFGNEVGARLRCGIRSGILLSSVSGSPAAFLSEAIQKTEKAARGRRHSYWRRKAAKAQEAYHGKPGSFHGPAFGLGAKSDFSGANFGFETGCTRDQVGCSHQGWNSWTYPASFIQSDSGIKCGGRGEPDCCTSTEDASSAWTCWRNGFSTSRAQGSGGGEAPFGPCCWRGPGESSPCAISSSHSTSWADCTVQPGPHGGFGWRDIFSKHEGSSWTSETSSRTSHPFRRLLPVGLEIDGKTNAANSPGNWDSCRAPQQGDQRNTIHGTLRGLRKAPGSGFGPIPGDVDFGLFAVGQSWSCEGRHCPFGGLPRPGSHRQWPVRLGRPPDASRRPSVFDLHQQTTKHPISLQNLLPPCGSTMGDGGSCFYKRTRGHQQQAPRDHGRSGGRRPERPGILRSTTKRKGSAKASRQGKGKEPKCGSAGSGGGVRASGGNDPPSSPKNSSPEGPEPNPLADSISFTTWAICLPRWILRSRTDLAWHLRRSFQVSVPQPAKLSTTVFPLPLPSSSLWCWGSFSKLSRRRLLKLCRARLLHVIVFALDFLYLGRYPTVEELWRRPSVSQTAVHSRLRAFVAVCGSSGELFPLAPGRSGPELGAALMQLERFIDSEPVFQGGYLDGPVRFREDPDLFPRDEFPQLFPYRSLDSARLKLVGQGAWPMEKFIEGPLWLPFQEPAILRHGLEVDFSAAPNFKKESRDECLRLVKLWDSKGLVRLFEEPAEPGLFCRVFNAFKSPECDRQIGDRRLVNMSEMCYDGPSRFLPQGPSLAQVRVDRFCQRLVASVTDRRDFYHQAAVTASRAQTNLLPFSFEPEELVGLEAFEREKLEAVKQSPKGREVIGDRLGLIPKKLAPKEWTPKPLFAGFASLFQGDHLGVEFALCAHQQLLEDACLLRDGQQVKGSCPFPKGPVYSGLVIDDFFLISREGAKKPKHDTSAFHALAAARRTYEAEGLIGSTEKDIEAASVFKAAGAEFVSDEHAVQSGCVTVGAPRAKRLALAALSLRAARLPGLSPQLASRLAGNWSSVLLYRRCLSSVVDGLFALGVSESCAGTSVVPLPRRIARELVLLAIMSPLTCSNVAVSYVGTLFASDASLSKGAFVAAEVGADRVEELWLDTEKKGSYALLDCGFKEMLKHVGEYEGEEQVPAPLIRPKASPLLYYDFVEICGGVGAVSAAACELGLVCAPPLDLSASEHYDLGDLRLLEWVIYMVEENRFRSFLLEPPCTTFSPAAHPCLRSYVEPYGFDRMHPRVMHGNCLSFRSLVLMRVGRRCARPCGLEQPRRSKMAWLDEWISLVQSGDFEEAIIAACRFNSPHQKEFRFLLHRVSAELLEARCTRDHAHVRIQGKFTKDSAIYTPELGLHLALAFRAALRTVVALAESDMSCEGLESVVTNDIMCTSVWQEARSWFWKRPRHINALEVSAGVAVLNEVGPNAPHSRVVSCLDSAVARGALSKGRSTSTLLQPLLRRSAVLQVCFDLYPVWPFCPTRHNVADDPTRDVVLRERAPNSVTACHGIDLRLLHRVGLKRFAANWIRLFLLVSCVSGGKADGCHDPLDFNPAFWTYPVAFGSFHCPLRCFGAKMSLLDFSLAKWTFLALFGRVMSFALTTHRLLVGVLFWLFMFALFRRGCQFRVLRVLFGFYGCVCVSMSLAPPGPRFDGFQFGAFAMEASSVAERRRAAMRTETVLKGDRVILDATRNRRKKLLKQFQVWLWSERGVSLKFLLQEKPPDPEKISEWLVAFGRELFRTGKAYGIFAETINAVSAARPAIRKQLTLAWDYAFSWVADEPFHHRPAMPASVLLAILAVALFWGWVEEAAIFGMAWAGLLRIGEALQALRSDLVLPEDAAPGMTYALLRIREPKTRGRHAKHQAARIDPADIVQLLQIAFSKKSREQKLWPLSASTLRKRLADLLKAIKLPTEGSGSQHFDLSSLRPGGASWLLSCCEDSEMVRRRGRWATTRTMEIYLQEVQYVTFVERLPAATKEVIHTCAAGFPDLLKKVQFFTDAAIPSSTWFTLLRDRRSFGT